MEANEASAIETDGSTKGRLGRTLAGIVAGAILAPVAGMILVFALLPALPIALPIGLVLGWMQWHDERKARLAHLEPGGEAWDEPDDVRWGHGHGHVAHA